jgi:hypothetical protein
MKQEKRIDIDQAKAQVEAMIAKVRKEHPHDRDAQLRAFSAALEQWVNNDPETASHYFRWQQASELFDDYVDNATTLVDGMLVPRMLRWECQTCKEKTRKVQDIEFFPNQVTCDCGRPMVRKTHLTSDQQQVLLERRWTREATVQ